MLLRHRSRTAREHVMLVRVEVDVPRTFWAWPATWIEMRLPVSVVFIGALVRVRNTPANTVEHHLDTLLNSLLN